MEPTNASAVPPTNTAPINTTDTVLNDLRLNTEWIITLLLCFFLGGIGVHRFYNGKIGTGILMIVTLGGFGIWYLIDLIMVIVGRFTKKDGTLIPIRVPVN